MKQVIDLSAPRIIRSDYTDRHLQTYIYQADGGAHSRKIRIVFSLLGDLEGKNVLDLGIGSGFYSRLCAEAGANVFSLDHADCIVDHYRENGGSNVIQASCETLPLRSDSFDLILALDVIEHLYEPMSFLQEVYRILKTTGRLVLVTDNADTFMSAFKSCVPSFFHPHLLWLYRSLVKNPGRAFSSLERKLRRQKTVSAPPKVATNPPRCTHVVEFGTGELAAMVGNCGLNISRFGTFAETRFYDWMSRSVSASAFLRGRMWHRVYFVCVKS